MRPTQGEAARLGHDSEAIAGFLPLVDVLLAVLCVAMVLAGQAKADRQVPVQLPNAVGAQAAAPVRSIRLAFDRDGKVWLDGQPTNEAELPVQLRSLGTSACRVVVAGDAEAGYGTAARLLQLVRSAGIDEVGLAVEAR